MKLYAPRYYRRFACLADQCTHSCCVGWEIDVDPKTAARYAALTEGYGRVIRDSIAAGDPPHIRLTEGDRCPHLDERGLCRVITAYGEGYLCEICREHPRFYHQTAAGCEVGLGMACEEACRLILTTEEGWVIEPIGETEGEVTVSFDALSRRAAAFSLLFDSAHPYPARLQALGRLYDVCPNRHPDGAWRKLLAEAEYMDEAHRSLFACYSSDARTPTALEAPLSRALAYFIFRHCSGAEDEEEFAAALGFSLVCERLLCSLARQTGAKDVSRLLPLARILSEELEYSEDNTEALKWSLY